VWVADDLIGTWTTDPADKLGIEHFGHVTLVFDSRGKLTYRSTCLQATRRSFLA